MSEIGSRIKSIRVQKNMKQTELAKILGVGFTTISNYETGYSLPDIETISMIAKAFNVSVDYLLGNESKFVYENLGAAIIKPQPGEKIASIYVLGTIPAGVPVEAIEDYVDTEEIVIGEFENSDDYFGLRVQGDSMAPRIMDGDVVIVKKQSCIENNEVAVVMINGYDATLKRVKKSESGITLIPDNTSYSPTFYSNDEIEKLPIIILGRLWELRGKY